MKMKKIVTLGLMIVALAACRPEAYSEIGSPYSTVTGIDGNWTLTKVEIEDRSFPQWETREVSDYFLNENAVSMVIDASSSSFQITANSLDGLPFEAMTGTYAYDDPEYPSNMFLMAPGSSDTTTVELGNMVRTIDPMMLFQEMKSSCGEVYARYIYTFNRTN